VLQLILFQEYNADIWKKNWIQNWEFREFTNEVAHNQWIFCELKRDDGSPVRASVFLAIFKNSPKVRFEKKKKKKKKKKIFLKKKKKIQLDKLKNKKKKIKKKKKKKKINRICFKCEVKYPPGRIKTQKKHENKNFGHEKKYKRKYEKLD